MCTLQGTYLLSSDRGPIRIEFAKSRMAIIGTDAQTFGGAVGGGAFLREVMQFIIIFISVFNHIINRTNVINIISKCFK